MKRLLPNCLPSAQFPFPTPPPPGEHLRCLFVSQRRIPLWQPRLSGKMLIMLTEPHQGGLVRENEPGCMKDRSVLTLARTLSHEYVRECYQGRRAFSSSWDMVLVTG